MEQSQQVILSIKRTLGTIDGQIINYLQTEPFDLGNLPEIVMLTLKEYWLPFTISADSVDGEVLRQKAIWSIKQLEAQAALIREVFLESHLKTAVVVNNAEVSNSAVVDRSFTSPCAQKRESEALVLDKSLPNSDETLLEDDQQQDEDDEDLGLLNLKLTDELKVATELLGFEQSNGKSL